MKNGILRDDEGYDLLVNGEVVSFRDLEKNALTSAVYMKTESKKYSREKVQLRTWATGLIRTVLPDGRVS